MALLAENDILFAQKALLLTPGLTDATKRVAGAILDHFNKRTGQCDPGIERLSTMLGLSRATVLRATEALCEHGLFEKDSHGGKSHRAAYRPQWQRFRRIVADWDARMKVGAAPGELIPETKKPNAKVSGVQRSRSQDCDVKGRKDETQTLRINQSNKPIETEQVETHPPEPPSLHDQKRNHRLSKKDLRPGQRHFLLPMQGGKQVNRKDAARDAAQRRWECDAKSRGEQVYFAVAEWITPERQHAATEAEMQRKGGGWAFIAASMHLERNQAHG